MVLISDSWSTIPTRNERYDFSPSSPTCASSRFGYRFVSVLAYLIVDIVRAHTLVKPFKAFISKPRILWSHTRAYVLYTTWSFVESIWTLSVPYSARGLQSSNNTFVLISLRPICSQAEASPVTQASVARSYGLAVDDGKVKDGFKRG